MKKLNVLTKSVMVIVFLMGFASLTFANTDDAIGDRERDASLLRLAGLELFGSLQLDQAACDDPKAMGFEVTYLSRHGLAMSSTEAKEGFILKFYSNEETGEQNFDSPIFVQIGEYTTNDGDSHQVVITKDQIQLENGKAYFKVKPEKSISKITVALYNETGDKKYGSVSLVLEKFKEDRDYALYYSYHNPFNKGFLKAMKYNRRGSKRLPEFKVYIKQ